jgi:serine/threonine protein kinase
MPTPHSGADLNLLFGILALQLDFITREQLVGAVNAWVLAKHKALGDILKEQGALDAEQHDVLWAMMQAHLRKHGNGAEKSLAVVPLSSGLKEQIKTVADADLTASLGHLSGELDPYATRSFSVGEATSAGRRFRILRPHARGGLGEVFVAEDMELHREVALKEIQGQHADHAGSRGRFILEAEITGGLEHPGIVPVYGLGAYPDGRPFYAMRFIRGDNLKEAIARFHNSSTDYADFTDERQPGSIQSVKPVKSADRYFSLEFRKLLGRFVDVCNAVAYAHSRGVLHRDLKPGNVMLGKFGETLVVDWGLAKVKGEEQGVRGEGVRGEESEPDAQARDGESPLRLASGSGVAETVAGSAVGTPAFMSPEQASGQIAELGPATDIYSLGATLYTLLTNRPPITGSDTAEVLRKAQRGDAGFNEPGATAAGIPAPLVAICNKAMSPDPRGRYTTPLTLAEDLEHWLADEPVKAAPDLLLVRTRRWMRKHPGPVSGIAAAVLVGIVGLAIGAVVLGEKNQLLSNTNARLDAANTELKTSNQNLKTTNEKLDLARRAADTAAAAEKLAADQERAARLEEERQRKFAEAIRAFVEHDFLALTSVEGQDRFAGAHKEGLNKDIGLRELLDRAAEKLRARKDLEPRIEAELCWIVGVNYRADGEAAKGVPFLERAVALRKQVLGLDHQETLNAQNSLAVCYDAAGKLDLALPLYEETLKLKKAKLGPEHPDTLIGMGNLAKGYHDAGKLDMALPLLQETFKLMKAKLGVDHPYTLISMDNLARGYHEAGKLDLALPLYEEALKLSEPKLGLDHPHTLVRLNNVAEGYRATGKLDLAVPLFEETLKLKKAKLGPDHPQTLNSINNLARAYHFAGKLDLALPLYEEALKLRKAKLGPDHPDTLSSMASLAAGYHAAGKLDLALPLYKETLDLTKARVGPDHPDTLSCMNDLALGYHAAGKLDPALPLYEKTLKLRKARLGPDHPDTLSTMNNLALCYHAAGKLDLALPLYEETLKLRKTRLGLNHLDTLTSMHNLARGYQDAGKLDLALPLYEETLKLRKTRLGPYHSDTLSSMDGLANAYWDAGNLDLALPLYEETLKLRKGKLGPDHPDTLNSMASLARGLWRAKRLDRSIPLFEEALKQREEKLGRTHPDSLTTRANLGVNYRDAGRLKEALPLLEEAYRASRAIPVLRWVGVELLAGYAQAGKPAEAAGLVKELLAEARKTLPRESAQLAATLAQHGLTLLQVKAFTDAEPLLRECLAIREKQEPQAWTTFNTQSMLGGSLLGQKKYADGEPLLKAAYEGMKARAKTIPPQDKMRLTEAAERLVQLFEATGNAAEAERWRKELAAPKGAPARRQKK